MRRISFIGILLFLSSFLYAETGDYVYDFLQLPISSRASALGGVLVASPENDLNLAFHNPALLHPELHGTLSIGYMNYISDIQLGQAAYTRKTDEHKAWMAGIRYLDYGDITAADIYGQTYGRVLSEDMALTFCYSFAINDLWQAGIGAHLIYSLLDEYTSLGGGVDLGVHYSHPEHGLWAGIVVKNLGSQFRPYDEHYEPLPWDIQLGITKALEHAPFRLSCTAYRFNAWNPGYHDYSHQKTAREGKFFPALLRHFIFGLDAVPSDNLTFSFGYNVGRRQDLALEQRTVFSGMSAGFSMKIKSFRLGASYSQYHISGNSLQMTFATDRLAF